MRGFLLLVAVWGVLIFSPGLAVGLGSHLVAVFYSASAKQAKVIVHCISIS